MAHEDDALLVRFYRKPVLNSFKTDAEGKPAFDNEEMISIMVPGSRDEFVSLVTPEIRTRFDAKYKAWKAMEDAPIIGTPLSEWPLATTQFVEDMKMIGVRSVEDLANLGDDIAMQSGFTAAMREKAIATVNGHLGDVTAEKAKAEAAEAKAAALEKELAEMKKLMESATAPQVKK